jgi:hypothetical protein
MKFDNPVVLYAVSMGKSFVVTHVREPEEPKSPKPLHEEVMVAMDPAKRHYYAEPFTGVPWDQNVWDKDLPDLGKLLLYAKTLDKIFRVVAVCGTVAEANRVCLEDEKVGVLMSDEKERHYVARLKPEKDLRYFHFPRRS